MFSDWLAKLRGVNIRQYGDGNPGAVNAFKAAGWKIGTLAMLLDYLKGALPVYLIIQFGNINDFWLAPIAIAPVLGHAFSLFMRYKGGKAIATTFGVWSALTLWQVPVVFGLGLVLFKIILRLKNDAWSTVFGMLIVFMVLIIRNASPTLLTIFLLNFIIVIYKHKLELRLVKIYPI